MASTETQKRKWTESTTSDESDSGEVMIDKRREVVKHELARSSAIDAFRSSSRQASTRCLPRRSTVGQPPEPNGGVVAANVGSVEVGVVGRNNFESEGQDQLLTDRSIEVIRDISNPKNGLYQAAVSELSCQVFDDVFLAHIASYLAKKLKRVESDLRRGGVSQTKSDHAIDQIWQLGQHQLKESLAPCALRSKTRNANAQEKSSEKQQSNGEGNSKGASRIDPTPSPRESTLPSPTTARSSVIASDYLPSMQSTPISAIDGNDSMVLPAVVTIIDTVDNPTPQPAESTTGFDLGILKTARTRQEVAELAVKSFQTPYELFEWQVKQTRCCTSGYGGESPTSQDGLRQQVKNVWERLYAKHADEWQKLLKRLHSGVKGPALDEGRMLLEKQRLLSKLEIPYAKSTIGEVRRLHTGERMEERGARNSLQSGRSSILPAVRQPSTPSQVRETNISPAIAHPSSAVVTTEKLICIPYESRPHRPGEYYACIPVATPELPFTDVTIEELTLALEDFLGPECGVLRIERLHPHNWVVVFDNLRAALRSRGRPMLRDKPLGAVHWPESAPRAFFADPKTLPRARLIETDIARAISRAFRGRDQPDLYLYPPTGNFGERYVVFFQDTPWLLRFYMPLPVSKRGEVVVAAFKPMDTKHKCTICGQKHSGYACARARVVDLPML